MQWPLQTSLRSIVKDTILLSNLSHMKLKFRKRGAWPQRLPSLMHWSDRTSGRNLILNQFGWFQWRALGRWTFLSRCKHGSGVHTPNMTSRVARGPWATVVPCSALRILSRLRAKLGERERTSHTNLQDLELQRTYLVTFWGPEGPGQPRPRRLWKAGWSLRCWRHARGIHKTSPQRVQSRGIYRSSRGHHCTVPSCQFPPHIFRLQKRAESKTASV